MSEKKEIIVSENELKTVVESLLNINNVEIIDYEKKEFQGGTLGQVYSFSGQCKTSEIIDFEVILKVQSKWGRFGDPESWFREYSAYQTDLFSDLPKNLYVPKCILSKKEDTEIWLWIEKAKGNHEKTLTVRDYGKIANMVGEYQSNFINKTLDYSWFSSKYWFSKNINIFSSVAINWLLEESQKEHSILSVDSRKKLLDLWSDRDILIQSFLVLPTTICHRDLTPGNVFVNNELVTLIDWDCVGNGIVGEDISDLFMEALVYYDFDLDKMSELEEELILNYYKGIKNVSVEEIKKAFDLNVLLVWSFRIICMFEYDQKEDELNRLIKILEYITKR